MALNPDDLLIFKVREEEKEAEDKKKAKASAAAQKQQAKPVAKQPAPVQKPPEQEKPVESSGYNELAEVMSEGEPIEKEENRGTYRRGHKMDPRTLAEHMNCELHPWRRAYALCDYCKRAFCYEDLIESGGKYYCLDDIDKVPETVLHQQIVRYNSLSLVSALLYMAAFLIFIYYTYPQVITLSSQFISLGLYLFANKIAPTNLLLLIEMMLSLIALIGAMTIILSTKNSFRFGAFTSILGVAIFSYQYINLDKLYLVGIAGTLFLAFLTLAYSRVSYETLNEEDVIFEDEAKVAAPGSF